MENIFKKKTKNFLKVLEAKIESENIKIEDVRY